MAVYLTGDTHSLFNRFSTPRFPEQKELNRDDVVIVLGDFGGVWNINEESHYEKWWLDCLEEKSFTLCFVDGNHENFQRLYNDYPEVAFHGGKAHKIRENIYHLMRGYIFEFNGKKFFCMGGARSHDIKDGIFDMNKYSNVNNAKAAVKRWIKQGKEFRIKDFNWWSQELPNDEELDRGIQNLELNNWEVDYVITHCLPQDIASFVGFREGDKLTLYFMGLLRNGLKFKKWYCGHYHQERSICEKFIIKYENIERII